MKSLYYCRSLSIQRAEKAEVVSLLPGKVLDVLTLDDVAAEAQSNDYEECLACQ